MLKEGNPLSFSGLEVNLKRNGREKREAREAIFRSASEEDLARLTDNQLRVLNLIFPPEGKRLTLEKAGEAFGGVTREAIRQTRDNALEKLERLQRGEPETKRRGIPRLEMDSNIRELLLKNKDLSMGEFRELLGYSVPIIRRWIDEAEMPRRKTGRPRKEKLDVPRNPVGRPRKSGVSF